MKMVSIIMILIFKPVVKKKQVVFVTTCIKMIIKVPDQITRRQAGGKSWKREL